MAPIPFMGWYRAIRPMARLGAGRFAIGHHSEEATMPLKPRQQGPPGVQREYFSQKEIAAKLGVSEASVRGWIKTGIGGTKLRAIKLNRSVRVHWTDLERFLNAVRKQSIPD
jgi:hypothetical protein